MLIDPCQDLSGQEVVQSMVNMGGFMEELIEIGRSFVQAMA